MVLRDGDQRGRRSWGARVAPWFVLVLAVSVLALALGVPWWLVAIIAVVVLAGIVFEA